METPKIYVADLEAYNSGRLVGKWFDLDDYSDADELVEAIEEYMTSLGKEEYAIHDIENFPREFYSEYMGKSDFEKVYEIMEKAKEFKLPLEVVAEVAREYSIDAVDGFQGKYDDISDFAYEMVEEIGIDNFSKPEVYTYVSETDKRIIAGEEGDNFVDNLSDREIIEEADMDFDEYQEADEEAQEKMLEEAKDIVRKQIYEEWYEGLDDPYDFLVEEKGMYKYSDLKNLSFVQIDYEKLANDLEYDYNTVEYDGDVYVFNPNYAKGGFLSRLFGGGKKEYNRSWHQDHSQVNKAEKWERQDGMRHGKKARNRYEDGGQMSMFARGGMTKNEEIMRSFLISKGEFEVNNLSTHYNQYDDMMLLRNYYTLIATRKGNVVKITDKKYSKSTSTIVNALVRMARDMGFEVDMVTEFAKGGKTYNRSWHQDHYNVNKEESWERQDGVRHGKTARNRYAKGGETSKKGSYSGRIVETEMGSVMIGNISGYRGNGEPVYDVHEYGDLRKDIRRKVGELGNEKIKQLLKSSKYAKGGKLKSYKYVPNRNIESVTLTQGEGTITIPQDNILDGVYIRKRYKAFGRGGNTGNYNEGLSWKLDRERFAKKQAYEVQYRKHK